MYYGNGWEHYNDVEGLIIYRLLLCGPPSPPCPTVLHNVRFFNFSFTIQIMYFTYSRQLYRAFVWNLKLPVLSVLYKKALGLKI
jgi:hypothetical protein